jgi:hypothetical protein
MVGMVKILVGLVHGGGIGPEAGSGVVRAVVGYAQGVETGLDTGRQIGVLRGVVAHEAVVAHGQQAVLFVPEQAAVVDEAAAAVGFPLGCAHAQHVAVGVVAVALGPADLLDRTGGAVAGVGDGTDLLRVGSSASSAHR